MSLIQILRRDIYPRLDHARIFGDLSASTEEGTRIRAACPSCQSGGVFLLDPNRAHGFCLRRCGRISWWGMARRVMELAPEEALAWLADRARVELAEVRKARFKSFEQAERRADLLESIYQLSLADRYPRSGAAKGDRAPGLAELGDLPGNGSLLSRLKRRGFQRAELHWLLEARIPKGGQVVLHRGFEGEGLGLFWIGPESGQGLREERFVSPAPLPPPLIPFRFNEVVGSRTLVLVDSVRECLRLVENGLAETCAFVPGIAEEPQLQAATDWRIGAIYLEPDSPYLAQRIETVRRSGVAVPLVMPLPARTWTGGPAGDPDRSRQPDLLADAVHGTRWNCQVMLQEYDLDTDAQRQEAFARLFLAWQDCESPLERDHMIDALAEACRMGRKQVFEEFQVRENRQTRTQLESSYKDLFREGDSLAGQGRFEELKDLLFRKNAEIAGRGFLERPEPFEPGQFCQSVQELPEGIKTGYPDLDRYIRILPGEVIVVGARPSHGKTTFAINLLYNLLNFNKLFRREEPFIFFSYELNEEFVTAKLLSRMTGRHSFYEVLEYLRSGLRTDSLLEDALARLKGFGPYLYIVCKPRMTAEDLLAFCQSVWFKHGCIGAVLIDYLQIVSTPRPMPTREQEISYIIKQLRIAGTEFKCPILSLAQAVRGGPEARLERPGIQHLMDGRVIEQESNTILMLFNPEIQKAQSSTTDLLVEEDIVPLEVVVRKNKYGAINRIIQLEYKMRTNEIKNRGGFVTVYEI